MSPAREGGGHEAVLRLLRERSGLVFPPARRRLATAAIERAMREAGTGETAAYLELLRRDGEALAALLAEVTVGETYFFREPGQLSFLRDRILPEVAARRGPAHVLRAWSAGCATGEEAYTLAILAREAGLGERMEVLGTDVSLPRLEVARRGRYRRWSLRDVPERVVGTWFTPAGSAWEVVPAVRRGVRFAALNLAEGGWPSAASGVWGMDVVLCRNVLIYLDPGTVADAARRIFEAMSEGAWLVPGASDPVLSELVDCEVEMTGSGLVYRRKPGPVREPRRVLAPHDGALPTVPEPVVLDRPLPPAPAPPSLSPEPTATAAEGGPTLDDAERAFAERDYARAASLAEAVAGRGAAEARAWVLRVRALANAGRVAEAAAAADRAAELHRTDAELAYLHALLLLESGRAADALAAVRRALYLEPGLAVAHLLRATAAWRVGRVDDARLALENAEAALDALPPGAEVPAGGGESAGRLLASVRSLRDVLAGGAT